MLFVYVLDEFEKLAGDGPSCLRRGDEVWSGMVFFPPLALVGVMAGGE
jgi:hypothetical protein